jgi:hypothetical protein
MKGVLSVCPLLWEAGVNIHQRPSNRDYDRSDNVEPCRHSL